MVLWSVIPVPDTTETGNPLTHENRDIKATGN